MKRGADLSGMTFSRWTVLGRDENARVGAGVQRRWVCKCSCGIVRSVSATALRTGKSRSCGCLQAEEVAARNTRHGQYGTRTYEAWHSMLQRCRESGPASRWYNARGIAVCERWQNSFEAFLADMGECPERLTLDRVDNNSGYSKENCRWATWEQQNANRRPRSEWSFQKVAA
jgi:hypothetical protein